MPIWRNACFAILRDDADLEGRYARDVLIEALEYGLKLATRGGIEKPTAPEPTDGGEVPSEPKRRGRPKGSKNKPIAEARVSDGQASDADTAAEERKAFYAATEPTTAVVNDQEPAVMAPPVDDLGIPEFLRRTAS